MGACSGVSFLDSTSLAVGHPARISQPRVFAVDSRRGRTSVGWFYDVKLQLVVNDQGELLAFCLTRAISTTASRFPAWSSGPLDVSLATKGYISAPLAERLLVTQVLRLITKLRKNMRQQLLALSDRLLARKRALIETIVDQLKNVCQIEHARHRGPFNFLVPLLAGLASYCHLPKTPSLDLALIPSSPTLSKTEVVLVGWGVNSKVRNGWRSFI